MSLFSPPKPPDAAQLASSQQQYNFGTAAQQQTMNEINQKTPTGSLTYTSPNSVEIGLTPDLAQLAKTQQATAASLGNAASGMYSQLPNIDPTQLLSQQQKMFEQYYQPVFKQQQSNLDAKLQSQGIAPSSNNDPNNLNAYDRAQNLLSRNQNDARLQFFMATQPLAFQQALTNYQLPLQTEQSLLTGSTPQNPMFTNTPQVQIQPPNYQGAAQQQYTNQYQQYGDMMRGIGQLASGGLSGLSGFGGGGIGGGWGGGMSQVGPTFASGGMGMMGGVPFPIF